MLCLIFAGCGANESVSSAVWTPDEMALLLGKAKKKRTRRGNNPSRPDSPSIH